MLYARRKGWPLPGVEVDVRHDRIDGRDRIELELRLAGTRDQPQTERLRAVAGRCPVHRLLTQPPEIVER